MDKKTEMVEQATEQIVKQKQKRPKKSEQMSIHTEPGDNTKYLTVSMELANLPKVDFTKPEQVEERLLQFFDIHAQNDMKPTVTMPHYSEQQIETANSTSLVAFLNSHGEQLKKFGAQHLWEKHQVWVRDNRWYTHYDAAGGYAISFVMKYYAMDFQSAVAELLGGGIAVCHTPIVKEKKPMKFVVPKANTTMNCVYHTSWMKGLSTVR